MLTPRTLALALTLTLTLTLTTLMLIRQILTLEIASARDTTSTLPSSLSLSLPPSHTWRA